MERTQINVKVHPSELKRLQRAAKREDFAKFSQWVKHHLWKAAGIKDEPKDGRQEANKLRYQ